jgi:Tfp pilus assembly protein PilF
LRQLVDGVVCGPGFEWMLSIFCGVRLGVAVAVQRGRLWPGALLWSVSTALTGVASSVVTGFLSNTDTGLPGVFTPLKEHPVRWTVGIVAMSALVAFGYTRWQQRLALADDLCGPGSGTAALVEANVAAPGGLAIAAASVSGTAIAAGTVNFHAAPAPVVPGRVVNLPPRNGDFTGREDLFGRLKSGLESGPIAVAAVHGLGGIGKTQLALEFAHRGVRSGQYQIVWWIRAETPVTLAEDFAALAPGLGIPAAADQDQIIEAVRAVLHDRGGWLMVFDNAPGAASMRPWLPSGIGDVLITTRSRQWAGTAKTVGISEFSRAESLAYLREQINETDDVLDRIAGQLGDLPLALAQAAAYVRSTGLSADSYAGMLSDQAYAGRLLARQAGDGYPESAATTWLIHYWWLAEQAPASLELLRLCAFLNPDNISLTSILAEPSLLANDLTGRLAAACVSIADLAETVAALADSGLVTVTGESQLRLHRLVAQVTRDHLNTAQDGLRDTWASHCISLLAGLMPEQPWEPSAWPQCAALAPHIITATDHAQPIAETAVALTRLGQYLLERADYQGAEASLVRAIAIDEAVYGPDHPQVAIPLGNLGNVQKMLGEFELAWASQQRVLTIKEAVYGPDHPQVAITLSNLGVVQERLRELDAARASLERALAILEAVYGPDHPQVAVTLVNLGNAELVGLEAARASQERALAIFEAVDGPDHPRVAVTLVGLSAVQRMLGDLAGAQENTKRALAINEAVFGPDHPQVANTLSHLSWVQERLGGLEAARASLERALAIKEAVYGPDHPEITSTLTNLGRVQERLGGLEAARASYERALAIEEAVYGPDHHQVASTLTNLGIVQERLGELEAARASHERALAIEAALDD